LLVTTSAWAVTTSCVVDCGTTCTASSIQTAIGNATAGDTITVPAGACDWGGDYVTITYSKNITVIGLGVGPTFTVSARAFRVLINNASNAGIRISNMTFTGTTLSSVLFDMHSLDLLEVLAYGWRIDNIRITFTSGAISVFGVYGPNWGLIDNNTVSVPSGAMLLINSQIATDTPYSGSYDLSLPLDLGTEKAVYMENNSLTFTGGGAVSFFDMDGGGGRVVARYNNMVGGYVYNHWTRGSSIGGLKYEVYNNIFTATAGYGIGDGGYPGRFEGGTGVIFNNVSTGYDVPYFYLDDRRGDGSETAAPTGVCADENSWDGAVGRPTGNTETTGWPCLGQLGRGTGTAAGSQPSVPLYAWGNTGVTIGVLSGSENFIKTTAHTNGDKDYCDAATGAMPGSCGNHTNTYVSYACPHPLTGLTGGCNAVTAGTAGYNTEVEDPPDTTAPAISAFTVPSSNVGYVVPVTLTCTDAVGVTGWCLVETDSYVGCSWSGATITSKTFTTQGIKTLYAFCRDGSGNVSTSSTDSVTVTSGRGATFTGGTGPVLRSGTGPTFTIGVGAGIQGL
jgi:hypothetical protein